jgi:hypothetical protein
MHQCTLRQRPWDSLTLRSVAPVGQVLRVSAQRRPTCRCPEHPPQPFSAEGPNRSISVVHPRTDTNDAVGRGCSEVGCWDLPWSTSRSRAAHVDPCRARRPLLPWASGPLSGLRICRLTGRTTTGLCPCLSAVNTRASALDSAPAPSAAGDRFRSPSAHELRHIAPFMISRARPCVRGKPDRGVGPSAY